MTEVPQRTAITLKTIPQPPSVCKISLVFADGYDWNEHGIGEAEGRALDFDH